MIWRVGNLLVIAAILSTVVGCRQDASRGTIQGNVTFDGQPLKAGIIRFVPADGQTATADAPIADGEFTATVPLGEKRVEITAPKVVGKKKMYEAPNSPVVDIVEELLPERYHVRSELKFTVVAGDQSASFNLESGK